MQTLDAAPATSTPLLSQRRNRFGATLLGAILLVLGGLWALDVADAIDIRATVVVPAVLAVLGLGLIVGAANGPHSGLIVAGVFLSLAVVAAAAVPTPFAGGMGDRRFVVTEQSQLRSAYQVGVGNLVLDLNEIHLSQAKSVSISVGAGELSVLLPDEIPVRINATSGAGEINLLGQRTDGVAVSREYQSDGYAASDVRLNLDLNVGAGSIEVKR
ncbi:MAG TPA: LiaF domain-containing protein [Acidimicrobiia bacterium]|nr:LiaF domain-containing protein [Acidimicrobiia bacterium]